MANADLPTTDELVAVGRTALRTALDPAGTGAVNLRPGSRNDTALSVLAAMGSRLSKYASERSAAARVSSAEDEDLDARAADLYGEERKAAVAATGLLRLKRSGSSATTIPKGSRFGVPATASSAAVTFGASADVASSSTTADVAVTCLETGTRGNLAKASACSSILDPLPDAGWSVDVVTMDGAPTSYVFGGGAAEETTDELRARLLSTSPETNRRRGTRDAILAGTLRVPGVAFATIVESQDGMLAVFAGDANYALPTALKTAIETELLDWRCFGVPVRVLPFTLTTVTIVATIYMARPLVNYDAASIRADAVAAIKRYFDDRLYADEYYQDRIEAAMFSVNDEVQTIASTITPSTNATRPSDATYAGYTQLTRYVVSDASIQLTMSGPLTT